MRALLDGLIDRACASLPSVYIHLGGTAIVSDWSLRRHTERVWSDVDDIDTIWSLPETAVHRRTESMIQEAWTKYGDKIKTAVVAPPNMHGEGTGSGRTESFFGPAFLQESLRIGATFYVDSKSDVHSTAHVEDVAQIFLRLVEAALAGEQCVDWGHDVRFAFSFFLFPLALRQCRPRYMQRSSHSYAKTIYSGLLFRYKRRDIEIRYRSQFREDS